MFKSILQMSMRDLISAPWVVVLVFLAAAPLEGFAQSSDTINDSGQFFSITGQDTGLFSAATVNSVDPAADAFRYQLGAESQFIFRVADINNEVDAVFDNPLFCFDFAIEASPTVLIQAQNSSDQTILDGIGLTTDLSYGIASNTVSFSPSPTTQCFYTGTDQPSPDSSFGLFGVPPASTDNGTAPDGLIFSDRFERIEDPSVSVSFEGVPASVAAGALLTYDILIENTGDVVLDQLAFQEVFPGNASYFPASLAVGEWTCAGTCPAPIGETPIRLDSISLPVGESVRYTVSRTVDAGSTGGSTLALYAGAVDGPGQDAAFDVAQAEIPVVGVLQQFEVLFTEANPTVTAGGVFPDFTIRAVDSGGNTISTFNETVSLTLRDSTIDLTVLTSFSVTNGLATISNLSVPVDAAGTDRLIRVEFGAVTGDSATFDIAAQ